MFAVALAQLATPIEAEAAALARDLGSTAYEQRAELAAGLPAIVLLTPDKDRASALLAALRARGHQAVAFDAAAVVPHRAMTALRSFRLGPDALTATEDAPDLTLPYADLLALVRAVHERTVTTHATTTEKKLSLGRAVLSGGLVNSKSVTRTVATTTEDREQVLYLFRTSGPPWILRASDARYAALGPTATPSSLTNFLATTAALRARAPTAAYDDRLLRRRLPDRLRAVAGHSSPDAAIDLFAHLTALCTSRFPHP